MEQEQDEKAYKCPDVVDKHSLTRTCTPLLLLALMVHLMLQLGECQQHCKCGNDVTVHAPHLSTSRSEPASRVFVIGDWGREGTPSQALVADAMAHVASESMGVDLVVSVGDNFYEEGLSDANDPLFARSFSNVYNHSSLQNIPWAAVYGNHDWIKSGTSQLTNNNSSLKQRDSRWNMPAREFTWRVGDDLEFFMYDTSPWVQDYRGGDFFDFRGNVVNDTSADADDWANFEQQQLQWLEQALQASDAKFRVVVGHHPVYSNSESHGDTKELLAVNDVLQRNNIPVYMSGHDHVHQVLRKHGISYIVQGAGSETRMDLREDEPHDLLFGSERQGFSVVETFPERSKSGGVIEPAQMVITFIDAASHEELYRHVVTRSHKGNVVS